MYCAVMIDPTGGETCEGAQSNGPDTPIDDPHQQISANKPAMVQGTPADCPKIKVPVARSWSRTIDYGIFAVFAVQCVLTGVAAFVSLALSVPTPQDGHIWAVAISVVPLVVSSGILLATHQPRPALSAIVGGGVFAGQVWSASSGLPQFRAGVNPEVSLVWWGWQPTVTLCILVGATFSGRRLVVPMLIIGVSYLGVRLMVPTDWRHLTTEIIVFAQVAAVASLIVPVWRRIGVVADTVARRESAARKQLAPIRAREQRERAANRVLHDEIIHTLRALATPATLSRADLRAMVGNALAQLDSGPTTRLTGRDLQAELGAMIQEVDRLRVDYEPGPTVVVPPEVSQAIIGATAEALRNVERHSGAVRARVEVAGSSEALTVTITDTGRGFAPGAVGPDAFGLRWSIHQQMSDVGAEVRVDSGHGRGTVIRISWVRRDPHERSSATSLDGLVDLAGLRVALIAAIALPQTLGGLLQTLVQGPAASAPILSMCSAFLAGSLTLYSVRFRLTGPVTGWYSALLCLAGLVVTLMAGIALDPANRSGLGYFPMDLVAPLLLIVALMRPRWELLVTAVLVGGIAALMASYTAVGISGYLPAVFLCPVSALLILLVRTFVDHLALGTQLSMSRDRELEDERIKAEECRQGRAEQLQRILPLVRPFLVRLDIHELELVDPAVAHTAQLLELAVRDQLAVGKDLRTQTQQLILRARMGGCVVQINSATSGQPDCCADSCVNSIGRTMDTVLNGFLTEKVGLKSIVISVGSTSDGKQFVSALIRPPEIPSTVVEIGFSDGDTWITTEDFALLRVDVPHLLPLPTFGPRA